MLITVLAILITKIHILGTKIHKVWPTSKFNHHWFTNIKSTTSLEPDCPLKKLYDSYNMSLYPFALSFAISICLYPFPFVKTSDKFYENFYSFCIHCKNDVCCIQYATFCMQQTYSLLSYWPVFISWFYFPSFKQTRLLSKWRNWLSN